MIDQPKAEGFENAFSRGFAATNRAGRAVSWIFVRSLEFALGHVLSDVNASDHLPLEALVHLPAGGHDTRRGRRPG